MHAHTSRTVCLSTAPAFFSSYFVFSARSPRRAPEDIVPTRNKFVISRDLGSYRSQDDVPWIDELKNNAQTVQETCMCVRFTISRLFFSYAKCNAVFFRSLKTFTSAIG